MNKIINKKQNLINYHIKKFMIFTFCLNIAITTAYAIVISDGGLASLLRSCLAGISTTLDTSISYAEDVYKSKSSAPITATISLFKPGTSNAYLSTLEMTKTYKVQLVFHGTSLGTNRRVASLVPDLLLNKRILLVPIYNEGDTQISYWNCLTDADTNLSNFAGDSKLASLSSQNYSFIKDYTKNEYLGNCYTATKEEIDNLWNT
jgi:hypothetical protein